MSTGKRINALGLGVLLLAMMGVTAAAFFNLIIPEYRGDAFHTAVIACLVAEFVFTVYLGYAWSAEESPDRPDPAVLMRLTPFIGIWALIIIVISAIAAAPGNADTFLSDKLLIIQLFITILVFAGVFFQHRQAVGHQMQTAAAQVDRRRLAADAGGLSVLLDGVRTLASRHPEHAVALEPLTKRLDALRTGLQAASPTTTRTEGRPVEPASVERIVDSLHKLHDAAEQLLAADTDQIVAQIDDVQTATDRALTAVRQRENAMTF